MVIGAHAGTECVHDVRKESGNQREVDYGDRKSPVRVIRCVCDCISVG